MYGLSQFNEYGFGKLSPGIWVERVNPATLDSHSIE